MAFDPTTNRIPFGLLTPGEQKTLKAWPHGWEFHLEGSWGYIATKPSWIKHFVYRGKPAPITDTYYVNVYESGDTGSSFSDIEQAVSAAKAGDRVGGIQLKITDGKLVSVSITD